MTASSSHKQQVARTFSAAAATYDRVAHLQRAVGNRLLSCLPSHFAAQHIMDMGAGTGYFCAPLKHRFTAAHVTAVDLARGMLDYAQAHQQADDYVCADMEQLPFADQQFDLIFSSLAVQWSLRFDQTLAECARVLRPGGLMAFSSVLEGSLIELKNSWAQVDNERHVNQFRTQTDYEQLCKNRELEILEMSHHTHLYFYNDLRQLRHELRDLGANYLHTSRRPHLAARERLQTLREAYDNYRQAQGLPASWQIVYVLLRKPL